MRFLAVVALAAISAVSAYSLDPDHLHPRDDEDLGVYARDFDLDEE